MSENSYNLDINYSAKINSIILYLPFFFMCFLNSSGLNKVDKYETVILFFIYMIFGYFYETQERFEQKFLQKKIHPKIPILSILVWLSYVLITSISQEYNNFIIIYVCFVLGYVYYCAFLASKKLIQSQNS